MVHIHVYLLSKLLTKCLFTVHVMKVVIMLVFLNVTICIAVCNVSYRFYSLPEYLNRPSPTETSRDVQQLSKDTATKASYDQC